MEPGPSGRARRHDPDRCGEQHGLFPSERREGFAYRLGSGGANVRRLALQRAVSRADFERTLDRRIQTVPDRDIEREIAWLHFYPAKSGFAQYAGDALLRCK